MITTGLASTVLDPALGLLDAVSGVLPRAIDPVVLPADERSHLFPIEWWYLSGHLATTDAVADPYGFEVTVVRIGDPLLGIGLGMLGFFSLIDVRRRRYVGADRLAPISAYAATPAGFRVALDPPADEATPWTLESTPDATGHADYALDLRTAAAGLELAVGGGKPAVLHGDLGAVDFGGDLVMGYYSRTRLDAAGIVSDAAGDRPVTGSAWMDHQWGASRFIGRRWKFFAIQLDGGDDLMIYEIWRRGFSDALARFGTRVDATGVATPIDPAAIVIADAGAPLPGGYPVHNRIRIDDGSATELVVVPCFAEQQRRAAHPHALYPEWWEGACRVQGRSGGQRVTGRAFTELAGYNVTVAGLTDV